MNKFRLLAVSSIAAAIATTTAGCATTGKNESGAFDAPVEPEHMRYEQSMQQVSADISESLRLLAEVKNASTLKEMTPYQAAQVEWQSKHVPEGYDKPISMDFTGPLEALVAMVADAVGGVKFNVLGRKPIVEPTVRISVVRAPAIDVLRNAGVQLGDAGEIVVMPSSNLIELRYHTDQAAK